jgi:hypothetical protein
MFSKDGGTQNNREPVLVPPKYKNYYKFKLTSLMVICLMNSKFNNIFSHASFHATI